MLALLEANRVDPLLDEPDELDRQALDTRGQATCRGVSVLECGWNVPERAYVAFLVVAYERSRRHPLSLSDGSGRPQGCIVTAGADCIVGLFVSRASECRGVYASCCAGGRVWVC
jgi:hypothetical protein